MNDIDYQKHVMNMPLYDDVVLGLVGEVGEVVEHIKKDRRPGDRRKPLSREKLIDEGGDVLWYLTRLFGENGVSLEEVMEFNVKKLTERHNAA
jgi:NTP pyrophosphatase (non-canonical NTP hydrolase)